MLCSSGDVLLFFQAYISLSEHREPPAKLCTGRCHRAGSRSAARGGGLGPGVGSGGGAKCSLRSQTLRAGAAVRQAGGGPGPPRSPPGASPAPAGPAPLRRRSVPARSRWCGRSAAVSAARRKEGGARPAVFGSGGAVREAGSGGHGGP